jgi:hypothetical protein
MLEAVDQNLPALRMKLLYLQQERGLKAASQTSHCLKLKIERHKKRHLRELKRLSWPNFRGILKTRTTSLTISSLDIRIR